MKKCDIINKYIKHAKFINIAILEIICKDNRLNISEPRKIKCNENVKLVNLKFKE